MEDYIHEIVVPHRGGRRDQERPAQDGQADRPPRLRPGPDGPHRRVVGRRTAHAVGDRLRRPQPPAGAAEHGRGREDAGPGRRRQRRGRGGRRRHARRQHGSSKKPVEVADFDVRRLGHGGRRSVRDAARDDHRDQRRVPSGSRPWSRSSAGRPRSSSASPRSRRSEAPSTPRSRAAAAATPTGARHDHERTAQRTRTMPPKKKIAALVKVQLQAGAATPAPPVGTALGPHGVNIMEFCKAYNAADRVDARQRHPGRDHHLRGPVVHVHHQDPAGRRADQEGRRSAARARASRTRRRSAS